MVDPTGLKTTLDQGRNGLFEVITSSAYYATSWSTSSGGQYILTDVDKVDANTGEATLWFRDPVIASGVLSHRTGQMVASRIWIAPIPSTGDSPQGNLLYSNDSDPLVLLGSPIVSHGALWFATDHGIYEYDSQSGFRQASPFSGYIGGGCL